MELIEKGFNAENINKLIDSLNDIIDNGINVAVKYGVDISVINDMDYFSDFFEQIDKLIRQIDNFSDISNGIYYTIGLDTKFTYLLSVVYI